MSRAKTNPRPSLAGRRILLGVTGGIAAYKSADLVRRLKEVGADVQVVMTAGAQQFVTPRTFAAVSGRPVREDLWDAKAEAAMGHIELARWGDAIVIAPASADFIARLTQGRADELLTTLCLASKNPLFIAPAMNQQMWASKATQSNLKTLRKRGVNLLGVGVGGQACGDVGPGRMMEPLQIREALVAHFQQGPLSGVKAVVTAGPTREPLDPVRVLTNRSSGKMGFAVAEALTALGAQVTLIAGPVALPTPPGLRRIDVETAAQMHKAALAEAGDARRRPRAPRSRSTPRRCRWRWSARATSWPTCASSARGCSWSASPPRPKTSRVTRAASSPPRSWTWSPPTWSATAAPSTATTTSCTSTGIAAAARSAVIRSRIWPAALPAS